MIDIEITCDDVATIYIINKWGTLEASKDGINSILTWEYKAANALYNDDLNVKK